MKLLRLSMRGTVAVLALSSVACSRDYVFEGNQYSNPIRNARIKELYQARDACLARNAAPSVSGESDVAAIARAVALSCMPETDKLIALTNPFHDPRVTAEILKDNDSKAARYVLLARGDGAN